jgi:glutaredoxin 3
MEVLVYSTDHCPFCLRAKAVLDKLQVPFQEINLARDATIRAELAAKTGMMTFPQILVDGQLLGGFDELVRAVKADAFPPPDHRG